MMILGSAGDWGRFIYMANVSALVRSNIRADGASVFMRNEQAGIVSTRLPLDALHPGHHTGLPPGLMHDARCTGARSERLHVEREKV